MYLNHSIKNQVHSYLIINEAKNLVTVIVTITLTTIVITILSISYDTISINIMKILKK